jgi:hypothetical protein
MSSIPSLNELTRNASWLAQAFHAPSGMIRFVKMSPDTYRAASFLDDRMFQQPRSIHVAPANDILRAIPVSARQDARWIFHVGHVGSTLIARLLGELPGVLSVREPRILRDLAALPAARRTWLAGATRALLSRVFGEQAVALVKATSYVSEIAPELVGSGSPALFVYAQPRAYIASILAGENSTREMHILSEGRAVRMANRVGRLAEASRSDAHVAAAAWACEITSLQVAEQSVKGPVMWLDFDAMLGDIAGHLKQLAHFFDFAADDATLQSIAGRQSGDG